MALSAFVGDQEDVRVLYETFYDTILAVFRNAGPNYYAPPMEDYHNYSAEDLEIPLPDTEEDLSSEIKKPTRGGIEYVTDSIRFEPTDEEDFRISGEIVVNLQASPHAEVQSLLQLIQYGIFRLEREIYEALRGQRYLVGRMLSLSISHVTISADPGNEILQVLIGIGVERNM